MCAFLAPQVVAFDQIIAGETFSDGFPEKGRPATRLGCFGDRLYLETPGKLPRLSHCGGELGRVCTSGCFIVTHSNGRHSGSRRRNGLGLVNQGTGSEPNMCMVCGVGSRMRC